MPAGTPALRLLTSYLGGALRGPTPDSGALADALVRHVTELIALSLAPSPGEMRPAAAQSVRAARLAAIKIDIDRHLTAVALSVAVVAARHGITARTFRRRYGCTPADARRNPPTIMGLARDKSREPPA